VRRLALALAAVAAGACAPRLEGPSLRPDAPDAAGLYRASATDGAERARVRVWVHARPPDHLHLEVVAPVGGTVFVLDAGSGSVAASWMEDRVAIVAPADAPSMDRLLGIPLDAAGWVATILEGAPAPETVVEREGEAGALPRRLALRRGSLEVRLELEEVRGVRGEVGNGRPPEGFDIRPLASMEGPPLLEALLEARR
jgi:hypothetical protein